MIDLSNNPHLFLTAIVALLLILAGLLLGIADESAQVVPAITLGIAFIAALAAAIGLWGMISSLL